MGRRKPEASAGYSAKDIIVLEGLEPVRLRPGMYIGSVDAAGLHHLVWEILDNAIDEAINGHARRIQVTLHEDGSTVTISDNGRGIPVDVHPRYRKPALELILTTLHAGGKFADHVYSHSGGLHGVGASVVTALADTLVAQVRRDGLVWEQTFSRGKAVSGLRRAGAASDTGTTITFRPDPSIFPSVAFDPATIARRLEQASYLHKGLRLSFRDRTTGSETTYYHAEGLRAYLETLVRKQGQEPVIAESFAVERGEDPRVECVLTWTEATEELVHTFVNGIPTPAGGAHENGLKSGLVKAVRNYLNVHDLVPKGLSVTAEDVREGVVALLSLYLANPQFQGQTKERLGNPEVAGQIDTLVRTSLENFLLHNRTLADAVASRVLLAARARTASRAAAETVKTRVAVSHRLNLPGKLADCSSTDPARSELFIVEGDSAGGSAKQARDRAVQAVLPLRGKVLNAEQASPEKVRANKELSDLMSVLGCGAGKSFARERLRYHKVCLLMDADSDGNHICTLLLTFFYRHLPELIRHGHLYIAQPPLYKIEVGADVLWAKDDAEKDRILAGRNGGSARIQVQRFKGLGEMSPKTLKETVLDPRRRSLLRVTVEDAARAEATIRTLMGKEVQPRFLLISERAPKVEELDV